MATVASRTFRSSPHRDGAETWNAIVDLLTQGTAGDAKRALVAVRGLASSIIADRAPLSAPIIVSCEGPRTRIYCLYDEDAVEGSDANEDALGFDPLKGDWRVSLPCPKDDLTWIQDALRTLSARITARAIDAGISLNDETSAEDAALVIDPKGFLRP
jgi:hypothetical protein